MKLKDAAKRERIIQKTLEIVEANGLSGIKMTTIAKRAKIAPSNLYIYFKNKEDLLTKVFFETIERISNLVLERRRESPEKDLPYKLQLFNFYALTIDLKLSMRKEFVFFQRFLKSSYFKETYNEKLDFYALGFFELLLQGQRDMILKDNVELHMLLAFFEGSANMLIDMHHNKKIQLDEKYIQQSFELMWDALRQ